MSNVITLERTKDIARVLEAEYTTTLTWDLEDLNIDVNKIDNYYIKYGTLHVTYKDGKTIEYESEFGVDDDTDYKWADKETFYNEDFDEVELDI